MQRDRKTSSEAGCRIYAYGLRVSDELEGFPGGGRTHDLGSRTFQHFKTFRV